MKLKKTDKFFIINILVVMLFTLVPFIPLSITTSLNENIFFIISILAFIMFIIDYLLLLLSIAFSLFIFYKKIKSKTYDIIFILNILAIISYITIFTLMLQKKWF